METHMHSKNKTQPFSFFHYWLSQVHRQFKESLLIYSARAAELVQLKVSQAPPRQNQTLLLHHESIFHPSPSSIQNCNHRILFLVLRQFFFFFSSLWNAQQLDNKYGTVFFTSTVATKHTWHKIHVNWHVLSKMYMTQNTCKQTCSLPDLADSYLYYVCWVILSVLVPFVCWQTYKQSKPKPGKWSERINIICIFLQSPRWKWRAKAKAGVEDGEDWEEN